MPTATPTRELHYTPPWIPDELWRVVNSPKRVVVIEGATKTLKTSAAMRWLLERALERGKVGRRFWWVARSYRQAAIAYNRYKSGLRTSEEFFRFNDSSLTITLVRVGSVMEFRSAEEPQTLYGEDVWDCVGDEASRWREEAYHALESVTTATRGRIRLPHNVTGRRNWVYRLARVAEGADPDDPELGYGRFTAEDAVRWGVITQARVDAARAMLPDHIFNELYRCIPSEDGGNPFGLGHIEACGAETLAPGPPVCFGLDLGRKQDWTVLVGLNAFRQVCAFDRFQLPWEEQIPRIRDQVGRTPTLTDSTGIGDVVLAWLQEGWAAEVFFPELFTLASKQRLMESLAVRVKRREIGHLIKEIRREMEQFEFRVGRTHTTYEALAGTHDDAVCGLALANTAYERLGERTESTVEIWGDEDEDEEEERVEVFGAGGYRQ